MSREGSEFKYVAFVALAGVGLALCLPLARPYWFESDERHSYVLRVVEFAQGFRSGDFYPRWAPDFYGGYGSPFFVFYAPLVYWLAAAITLLGASAALALKCVIVLATLTGGFGVFSVVQHETERSDAAVLAALLYLAAPYRIANLYVRGDIAEYSALALLPWAIWAYRGLVLEPSLRRAVRWGVGAVLAHAALILCHTIMALWGTLLLVIVNLCSSVGLVKRRGWRQLAMTWAAAALALALTAFYTAPALVEQKYVRTGEMHEGYFDPVYQLLSFTQLMKPSEFLLAPFVILACMAAAATWWVRRAEPAAMLWAFGGLVCAWLSSREAVRFWELRLPLTAFIQFPWRLHGLADIALPIALGTSWAVLVRRSSWGSAGGLAVGACALLCASPLVSIRQSLSKSSVPSAPSSIRASIQAAAADEYLPRLIDERPTRVAGPLLEPSQDLSVVSAASFVTSHELVVDVKRPQSVALALHMYPGWRSHTLWGPASAAIETSVSGHVALRFPTPGRYAVSVSFGSTPLRRAAGLLSLFALLATWPALSRLSGVPSPGRVPRGIWLLRRAQREGW